MIQILTLIIALLLCAKTAWAEWTNVDDTARASSYVDLSTIRRSGNLAKMWDLTDYKVRQGDGKVRYLSVKSQNEYDCKEERTRVLAAYWYSGRMGDGTAVSSVVYPGWSWNPVIPGSIGSAHWRVACKKH